MRVFLFIALTLSLLTLGAFFFLSYAEDDSHGSRRDMQRFVVNEGDNVLTLSEHLEDAQIITSRYILMWHLARIGKTHDLVAGTYSLSGDLSPTEIAFLITEGRVIPRDIKVTFPEGWESKKMAERLTANSLPGADFLALAQTPKAEWRERFDFLKEIPEDASLEGFLFPDTYLFDREASAQTIIEKMLTNFEKKWNTSFRTTARDENKNIYEIVTLASIVENEVKSNADRAMVADLFLRRLSIGQALQSDATLQYILGLDKVKHSFEETRTESPYNTYVNPGLPPGPIGNPGTSSLQATLFPKKNPYFYFLNDTETGETIFSVTFEEHVKNKSLHGL